MKLNALLISVFFILTIIIFITSCKNAEQPVIVSLDKQKETETIHVLMTEQEQAWNRSDIEVFMKPYWKNDSLEFIGKSGITYGWQATLDRYKKVYPSPDVMGKLQFTNITTDILSDSAAFVIGRWQLFRTADTLAGYYTLLWKKMDGRWVIIADHSS